MIIKNNRSELVFVLKDVIKGNPTGFVMKAWAISFYALLSLGIIDKIFFNINQLILFGLVFFTISFFILLIIVNQIYAKKSEIGKILITCDEVIVKSNETRVFHIVGIEKIKIRFPVQSGTIGYAWGIVYFRSSENNEITLIYNNLEYRFLFASRKTENLYLLENIIEIWRKRGLEVDYIWPKVRI